MPASCHEARSRAAALHPHPQTNVVKPPTTRPAALQTTRRVAPRGAQSQPHPRPPTHAQSTAQKRACGAGSIILPRRASVVSWSSFMRRRPTPSYPQNQQDKTPDKTTRRAAPRGARRSPHPRAPQHTRDTTKERSLPAAPGASSCRAARASCRAARSCAPPWTARRASPAGAGA
jgi:hypothetical protein